MLFDFINSLGILSIVFWLVIIILLLIPYSYLFTRFISKAWYKSKNEENKYRPVEKKEENG